MKYRDDSSIWTELYRPRTIEDCVLPKRIKTTLSEYVATGHVPTMLLAGPAGCGKTTAARAMANELGADILFINASSEGSIDTVRTQMTQFASTVSLNGAKKITVLDEADGLSLQAQQGLRSFCETFSENHSIIFTCNFPNKISEALKSRSVVVDFKPQKGEKMEMLAAFYHRIASILKEQEIEFDKKVVLELVNKKFPDFRSCINELQRYAMSGSIDSGILIDMTDEDYAPLFEAMKNRKYSEIRKWVANHSDDSSHVFRTLYDKASEKLEPRGVPALVLIIGTYMHRAAFVADQEINLAAFFTEVISDPNIVWK